MYVCWGWYRQAIEKTLSIDRTLTVHYCKRRPNAYLSVTRLPPEMRLKHSHCVSSGRCILTDTRMILIHYGRPFTPRASFHFVFGNKFMYFIDFDWTFLQLIFVVV